MNIRINIKPATVGGENGIYIEESLCNHGEVVGRIDSSFHAWEKGGVDYDVAGTVLPH